MVEHSSRHLCVLLPANYKYLGTAVLGDGFGFARRVLNLNVDENFRGEKTDFPAPAETLRRYAADRGWPEPMIGLLTSASMRSYAASSLAESGLEIETHLTSGLSNARAVGDRAEFRQLTVDRPATGTINTIILVHHPLTNGAALECLMISAAARARVLQEAGEKSRVSDALATGTGTDSTVLLYPSDDHRTAIPYAGMHTLTGELVARTVMVAFRESLRRIGAGK